MKKAISILLSLIIVCGALFGAPFTESAVGVKASAATSGTCGDSVTWNINSGTLTISGEGEMYSYSSGDTRPWEDGSFSKIVVDSGVTRIGTRAFSGFPNVTNVVLTSGITFINVSAFENSGITAISIPDTVTGIGASAFKNCTNLISAEISSGMTSIPMFVFSGCTSLKVVTIPESITTIVSSAFTDCTSLESVYYEGTADEWENVSGKDVFDGVNVYFGSKPIVAELSPQSISVEIDAGGTSKDVLFTPATSGNYVFYSTVDMDTKAYLYDSEGNQLYYNDDGGEDTNFSISYFLEAGKTYRYKVSFYGSSTTGSIVCNLAKKFNIYYWSQDGNRLVYSDTKLYAGDSVTWTLVPYERMYDCENFLFWTLNDSDFNFSHFPGETFPTEGDLNFYANYTYSHLADENGDVDKEPTCRNEGLLCYRCVYCDEIIEEESIPAVGHVFVNGRCSYCNLKQTDLLESPHPYESNMNETYTITKPGAASISIVFSSDTLFENSWDYLYIYDGDNNLIGEYTGTELQNLKVTVPGDVVKIKITSDGSVTKYGFRLTDVIATFENCTHTETVTENTVLPTCTETGLSGDVYCVSCDYLISTSKVTPAKGHNLGEGVVVQQPTCTESGHMNRACSDCDYVKEILTENEEILIPVSQYPESSHSYGSDIYKDYTFTYAGADKLKITFSTDTKTESNYDFITIRDGNGTQIGSYSGTTLAGSTIEINGDSFTITLSSDSSVEYYGFSFSEIVAVMVHDELKIVPHSFPDEWTVDVNPGCETPGSESLHCIHCDIKAFVTEIPATGHSYGDWEIDRLATYNTPGERHKTCSSCSDVVTDNQVDYARFVASFIKNGGKCEEESRTLISEEPMGELPIATKTNYIFKGWTLSNGGTDYVTETDYITEDTNLYASWELIVPENAVVTQLPTKTGYCVGDEIETRGLKLLVTYTDGSTKTVSSGFATSYDFSESGEKIVSVTYTERNVPVTTSYSVYVNNPARLYSGTLTANAGETVNVPVYIEDNPGVAGFTVFVEYDDAVFTPVCVNDNELSGYGMLDDNIGYTSENIVQVSWSGTENYYEDGELFSITFEISGAADVRGDYNFNITYEQADTFDENTNDVVFECENASVTVINEQLVPVEIGGNTADIFSGRIVEIPVEVKNNRITAGTNFTLTYDSSVLTYSGVTDGIATTSAESTEEGKITVNIKNVTQSEDGTIFLVNFNVKKYYSGTTEIGVTSNDSEIITKSITVNATNPKKDMPAVVYSDEISGQVGDTVFVPIYIENNKGMLGMQLRIKFDSNVLKPAVYCNTEDIIDSCGTVNQNISSNLKKGRDYFDIIFYGDEEFKENGKIVTLKFTLLEAAPTYTSLNVSYMQDGTYTEVNGVETDVELDCKSIGIKTTGCFVDGEKVWLSELHNSSTIDLLTKLPAASSASIQNMVTSNSCGYYGTGSTFDYIADGIKTLYTIIVKGDIDGDSAIDVLDVMHVERACNEKEAFSENQISAADLNGDGKIAVEDYSAMVNLALH